MCDCISITFRVGFETTSTTIEINVSGTFNGENYYTWTYLGVDYYLYWNAFSQWEVSYGGLGFPAFPLATFWKTSFGPCPPLGSVPIGWAIGYFDEFTTSDCVPIVESCDCGIDLTIKDGKTIFFFTVTPTGNIVNGFNTYEFTDDIGFGLQTYTIMFNNTAQWVIIDSDGNIFATLDLISPCPIGTWRVPLKFWSISTIAHECRDCIKIEDRIFREYGAIQLPLIYEEQNRGYVRCCCEFMVLASPDSETWKTDKNSAWMKLSAPTDTTEAILYKNGIPTTYVPVAVAFINEPNAFYWTIDWSEVLASDGEGCYTLKISYNIAGIEQVFTWGVYTMKQYSIYNALKTARVRVMLNSHQEIEGINFSGSNVEDSLRFFGFIGNRQPNTETDNLIYQNREVKKVVRENLNSYEILTDPTCEDYIKRLTDLLLLSENELFISDYNKHNHSYRYLDLPAIVENSPEITYYPTSREASLKCVVGDKFKNKRSYY